MQLENIIPGFHLLNKDFRDQLANQEDIVAILESATHQENMAFFMEQPWQRRLRMQKILAESYRHIAHLEDIFDELNEKITQALLYQTIDDFQLLEPEEQILLSQEAYSKTFYQNLMIKKLNPEACQRDWTHAFHNDAAQKPLVQKLQNTKDRFLSENLSNLSFLISSDAENDPIYDWEHFIESVYYLYSTKNSADEKKSYLRKQFLTYLNVHKNLKESLLAPRHVTRQIKSVSTRLYEFIRAKDWLEPILHETYVQTGNLWRYGYRLSGLEGYFNAIGDARVGFQAWGLQGVEGGWGLLGFYDAFNYHRYRNFIAGFKNVLSYFYKPLQSFFQEYVQIAKYEHNTFWFIFRTTLPIVIMLACIVFAFSLVSPFAIHALLEILMLLPVLYFGIAVASAYVNLKNYLYEKYIQSVYGDIYHGPQYQVNARLMTIADGNEELAQDIAQLYIDILTECDQIIEELKNKLQNGPLSQEELKIQKDLIDRKETLIAEWYDVHDNETETKGIKEIKNLIQKRIKETGYDEYEQLSSDFEVYVDEYVSELEENLKKTKMPDGMNHSTYQWTFFNTPPSLTQLKEKCIHHKDKIAHIESIMPKI